MFETCGIMGYFLISKKTYTKKDLNLIILYDINLCPFCLKINKNSKFFCEECVKKYVPYKHVCYIYDKLRYPYSEAFRFRIPKSQEDVCLKCKKDFNNNYPDYQGHMFCKTCIKEMSKYVTLYYKLKGL